MYNKIATLLQNATVKNNLSVTVRYSLVAIMGFLLSVAFARMVSPEVFGQYQFVLTLLATFSVLSLPGLNTSALRSVANNISGTVTQSVKLSFLGSLLAVPCLLIYGGYSLFFTNQPREIVFAVLFFGFCYPFWYAANTWYVYYEGKQLFVPVSTRVIVATFFASLGVYFGLAHHLSVFWLLFLWLGINAIFTWFYFRQVYLLEEQEKETRGNIDIRYGMHLSLQKFVVGLTESIPIFVITFFIGYGGVASYQIAIGFLIALSGLIGALASISLPIIFSQPGRGIRGMFWKNFLVGVISSVGYFIGVKVFFLSFYGSQYFQSYQIALLLSFLPLTLSLRFFLVNLLIGMEKNKNIIFSYILANLGSLLLFSLTSQHLSFTGSVVCYLYLINILLVLFLGVAYFQERKLRSKKTF